MADQIAQGIADCTAFILRLARAGRRVRVVTDHGWLLIPGGLQKAVLDIAVVEGDGKRTRCARIKAGAPTSYDCAPWSMNADVRVAFATGAMSFYMGYDYAHGRHEDREHRQGGMDGPEIEGGDCEGRGPTGRCWCPTITRGRW